MKNDLNKAVEVLREGGVILYPTDTIWGIGCDATNARAVERLYQIKQRSDRKSMLVLLDSEMRLHQYLKEVPEVAWELLEVADKPLTIIYPGARNLATNLIAENGSIGIRLPKDDFCIRLIGALRKPIVSTSANLSGQPAPSVFAEIADEIKEAVDYVVQWRQHDLNPGEASSILELGLGGQIRILRK
ncbi:MAG: threonylcarbamoyl-AMP synthase [Bacteroidales bacterium]|nr:threonylcarbamoyl-AMP synthase [Bacteroidales bacterium]